MLRSSLLAIRRVLQALGWDGAGLLLGLTLVAAGARAIYPPAGLIVAGAGLVWFTFVSAAAARRPKGG